MTICASVKVRDGLVLATDSMSQIQGSDLQSGMVGVIKTYGHATKLFQVGDLPIGVMTYGIGNIGNLSIQGLMRGFAPTQASDSVEQIADQLIVNIKAAYDAQYSELELGKRPVLGCYIAGYSKNKQIAEECEFQLPGDSKPSKPRPDDQFGASWRGIAAPFTRLYMGFDPRIRKMLIEKGVSADLVNEVLGAFQAAVVYDGMPVQDAIDFAAFILKTTIGLASFEAGPDSCGGPLQIATILPDTGFQWIVRPSLSIQGY